MWDLIVSVPDHCLSFYFSVKSKEDVALGEFALLKCIVVDFQRDNKNSQ